MTAFRNASEAFRNHAAPFFQYQSNHIKEVPRAPRDQLPDQVGGAALERGMPRRKLHRFSDFLYLSKK